MHKKFVILIFSLLLFSISLFSGAFIEFFHAKSDGDNIVLTWQTTIEDNVKEYVIQRGTTRDNLIEIETIPARGSNSLYTYLDENAYKVTNSFYVYKLKIVDNDNSVSYSSFISVSHQVSSVKRTWGSIKALFR